MLHADDRCGLSSDAGPHTAFPFAMSWFVENRCTDCGADRVVDDYQTARSRQRAELEANPPQQQYREPLADPRPILNHGSRLEGGVVAWTDGDEVVLTSDDDED